MKNLNNLAHFLQLSIILFFITSCEKKTQIINHKTALNTAEVIIKKQKIEEVFFNIASKESRGNLMLRIYQNGKQVYPPVDKAIPKDVLKALEKKATFTIPPNTNLIDFANILNKKYKINGSIEGNDFVIKL
ncbi:hypothetical protein AAEX28_05380 [Lentisphaerota bacterium WC36G]|nr:hypothetical protein LJT99_08235 [Lentisphaerae bacterium WC36]